MKRIAIACAVVMLAGALTSADAVVRGSGRRCCFGGRNQGGLPIIKDGKVIGGIGSGGSSAANDEKFAQAGLDATK